MPVEFTDEPAARIHTRRIHSVPYSSPEPEDAGFRFDPSNGRLDARRMDERWVSTMSALGRCVPELREPSRRGIILFVSDGLTSHCILGVDINVVEGEYQVMYMDPWGPERGSLLQAGRNVAGCTAKPVDGRPGFWLVGVRQLAIVLDDAMLVSRSEAAAERASDES